MGKKLCIEKYKFKKQNFCPIICAPYIHAFENNKQNLTLTEKFEIIMQLIIWHKTVTSNLIHYSTLADSRFSLAS